MNPSRRQRTIKTRGFSLVECLIALGIAAVVILTLLKIVPQTLDFQKEANDHSALAVVLKDVHHRIEGQILNEGPLSISPLFYDANGAFCGSGEPTEPQTDSTGSPQPEPHRFFRAEASLHRLRSHTEASGTGSPPPTGPWTVKLDLYWPLDDKGQPLGHSEAKTGLTWVVSTLTGPDWELIDPDYQPKLEY